MPIELGHLQRGGSGLCRPEYVLRMRLGTPNNREEGSFGMKPGSLEGNSRRKKSTHMT